MTALSSGHKPATWVSPWPSTAYQKPVHSGSVIYNNAVVAKNTSGEWVPASADNTLIAYGFARLIDAESITGDGTAEMVVDAGCKLVTFTGTSITQANEGDTVFSVDDQTASLSSSSGARPVMGVLEKYVSATSGYVSIHPLQSKLLTVEVTEASTVAPLTFSLFDFREVDGSSDVGNIAAIGGVLASNTTPILRGNAAETQEISWATGNVDPIAVQRSLPASFDGTGAVTVNLWVYSGSTDAATFTVESGWDGGALVSDTADDSATKSGTIHKITATIAASDIPDTASNLTLVLTPGTHGSDTIQLIGMRLDHKRKLLTV